MSSPELQQAEECEERAKLLKELGRFEEAIAAQEKATSLRAGSIKLDVDYWFDQGRQSFFAGDFEGALVSFDRSLEIKPDQHEMLSNRGIALTKLNRFEDAVSSFDYALKIKPDYHQAWGCRGVALFNLNRFEDAIASYDHALKIKPDYHEAWSCQGITFVRLNQFEDAIASFDHALKIKPDKCETWLSRGNVLANLNRFEDAIASFDHALKIKPGYHEAWNNRGIALSELQRFEDAIENYNTGLTHVLQETQPEGWGELHRGKGRVYYYQASRKDIRETHFHNQALACYSTALQTLKDFPEAYLNLIQDFIKVYFALEKLTQANEWRIKGLEVFRQLLNQQPTTRQKRLLEGKFSGFSHIAVDALVSDNQITTALETTDRYKNRCLTWILDEWKETVISPSYAEMRQLLSDSTAIVYWHLSEDALTTFILTPNSEDPILLDSDRASLTQRQQKLDQWTKRWDEHYNDYRSKGKEQSESKANHPWRRSLKSNLDELREILGIAAIEQHLSNIPNLILVPHRDLHRFPLHALFSEDYTISYLPSLQIGLNLQQKTIPQTKFLLSVEDPARDDIDPMDFAQLESAILRSFFSPNIKSISPYESDRATVETALKQHQGIFHFTGHGNHNERQPENSALGLKGNDELTAKAISSIDELQHYHLISLSACETALTGRQTIDAEYVGLVSAFLQAGVSSVVSTLWTVEEVSNAYLMIRFYQFWLSGEPPAIALKNAQHWLKTVTNANLLIWLKSLLPLVTKGSGAEEYLNQTCIPEVEGRIEKNQQPYCDPYYWAAFTLTGKSL